MPWCTWAASPPNIRSMPILQANIVGTYNLYEAARQHGVKRIVFASSNHVTGFYRQDEVIDATLPVRPDGYYGLSKAFGENLSRFYFDRYGIETVCLRIGSSFPEPKDRRMLATWLSYDDLERLVVAALTAPVVGHSIVYGMSDNTTTWWDNTPARHIGFRPQDSSEPFRAAKEAAQPHAGPQRPGTSSTRAAPSCAWARSSDQRPPADTNPKETSMQNRRPLIQAALCAAIRLRRLAGAAPRPYAEGRRRAPGRLPQRGGRREPGQEARDRHQRPASSCRCSPAACSAARRRWSSRRRSARSRSRASRWACSARWCRTSTCSTCPSSSATRRTCAR